MEKILHNILRKKVINLIKLLGNGLLEILIDVKIDEIEVATIEYNQELDKILLHVFDSEFDILMDFDDISVEEKAKILLYLKDYLTYL